MKKVKKNNPLGFDERHERAGINALQLISGHMSKITQDKNEIHTLVVAVMINMLPRLMWFIEKEADYNEFMEFFNTGVRVNYNLMQKHLNKEHYDS